MRTSALKIKGSLSKEHAIDHHFVHGELQNCPIIKLNVVLGCRPSFHTVQANCDFGFNAAVYFIAPSVEKVA